MNSSLIGEQNVATAGGRTQGAFNPATGEEIDQLGLSSAEEVVAAVEAATAAFPAWSATQSHKRAAVTFSFNVLPITLHHVNQNSQ